MEKLTEALEELKRVDHLIYVSLKYTRTVDVILNILGRMVDAYAFIVDALLAFATEKHKIISEPESAIERIDLIRRCYASDDLIVDNMGLYLLLRKLLRARNVDRENEYRRHVTMKTIIEGREEIVNIDIITNYYLYQREFLAHVRNIVEGTLEVEILEQSMQEQAMPSWVSEKTQHREQEDDVRREENVSPKTTPTPPVRMPLKVRPVSAPPRKRAPRPKKYKIQIPKGKNPIIRPPFEYDPRFNKELREAQAKAVADKAKAEASAKRSLAKKSATKKPVVKKKAPVKKPVKKPVAKKKR